MTAVFSTIHLKSYVSMYVSRVHDSNALWWL